MQLRGVLFCGVEPVLQAFLRLLRSWQGLRAQVSLNRQVVPHGVALQHTAQAAHRAGSTVRARRRQGKAGFVAPQRGQIDLHRPTRRQGKAIAVAQVQQGLSGSIGHGLELNAVVMGAQGPRGRGQFELEELLAGADEAVRQMQPMHLRQRLV